MEETLREEDSAPPPPGPDSVKDFKKYYSKIFLRNSDIIKKRKTCNCAGITMFQEDTTGLSPMNLLDIFFRNSAGSLSVPFIQFKVLHFLIVLTYQID